jgi:regulator of sigma D
MVEKGQLDAERRQGTRELIARLLEERQQMWVLYERVAGIEPYAHEPDVRRLEEFVQVLVDYIAAAHFGLYERIVNGEERRRGLFDLARDLYPRIAEITEIAVAFNDKYESGVPVAGKGALVEDLSKLGESLATRIELEDRLIARL